MISKSVFVKALSEMNILDDILKDHDVEEIFEDLNNPDKIKYHVFMQELLMNATIKQVAYDKKHKNNNPDYEAWKKDLDNPIWETLD